MASTSTGRKRTTVADLLAAAEVGAVDTSAEVLTAEDAAALRAEGAASVAPIIRTETVEVRPTGTDHECAIPGCRHGAAHGPAQPDRQVKLQCQNCGMVIRTTARWINRSGAPTCTDGGAFAVAARRTYRKAVAA